MAKCPNCGREAARTIDWVCEWCGYPLPDGSFKKIDKTFRELKEERLSGQSVIEEVGTNPKAKPEPAQETKPQPVFKLKPEPARKPEPPPAPQPAFIKKPVSAVNTPTEVRPPEPIIPPKPAIKTENISESKPAPPPEVKSEPSPVDIVITVAELLSAYETDGVAADARFANKILRITGVVEKINVKGALNIYSLTLNSPKKNLALPGVRCVFDRKFGPALNGLSVGQTVTVQGKYDGSMIDISLRDCFLVP